MPQHRLLKKLTVFTCLELLLLPALVLTDRQTLLLKYLGCYVDWVGGVPVMDGLKGITRLGSFSKPETDVNTVSGIMTWQLCLSVCSIGGFPYMGLQASIGCYCGFTYDTQGVAPESQCSRTCGGNASQPCGGQSRNTVVNLIYPDKSYFKQQFVKLPVIVGSSYTQPLYTMTGTRNFFQCVFSCANSCQAVIYNSLSGDCYLLKFPLMPNSLAGVLGDYWTMI